MAGSDIREWKDLALQGSKRERATGENGGSMEWVSQLLSSRLLWECLCRAFRPHWSVFPVYLCVFLIEIVTHSGWYNVLENALI